MMAAIGDFIVKLSFEVHVSTITTPIEFVCS